MGTKGAWGLTRMDPPSSPELRSGRSLYIHATPRHARTHDLMFDVLTA